MITSIAVKKRIVTNKWINKCEISFNQISMSIKPKWLRGVQI